MNNWQNEFMAEYHRQQILSEAESVHLEAIAVNAQVARPGFFARTMVGVANWMIVTGKQLRNRYAGCAIPCSQAPTGSFAQ